MALPQAHEPAGPVPFGKYELLGLLGSGGMAEVFLARALGPMGFERKVVVKRILPHLSSDEEFVAMFVEEAKLSATLSHGNIVHVYDFGEVDGQLFLAMEHVDGADLRSLARRAQTAGQPLPPELTVFVAIEVLSALAYAHERADSSGRPIGLVHRDVSPSNILVSAAGEVRLCDFGIAKIAARHTSTGRLKGKFGYMSPEQANGDPVDARTDLWAVGVVLWELLTGRKLFSADSDVGVLNLVSRGAIPTLPAIGVPNEAALRAVIERALTRDPARRYQDATTMAEDLRDYLVDAQLVDPQRVLREVVQRWGGPSARSPMKPVRPEPPAPRITVPDGATEVLDPGTSPSASAIVPVRRSVWPLAAGVFVGVVLLVLLVIALWPSRAPVPHATPGWAPRVTPTLPALPPLPPRTASPPTAAPSTPSVAGDPEPAAPPEPALATPSSQPRPLTDAPPQPRAGGAEPRPPASRPEPRPPASPEDPPTPPRSTPRPPSRESTVDPFAIQ